MGVSRSDVRKLSKEATEMGAHVLRGKLTVGPDGAKIGEIDVLEWLAQYANTDLILVAGSVGTGFIESDIKICYTCGRDYQGDTCPYCAEARARLRGI